MFSGSAAGRFIIMQTSKIDRSRGSKQPAAVGFTVKSGWACAVLLAGPPGSPQVADTRRIELSDPADPDSRQPYHAGFATARSEGRELSRLVTSVRGFGRKSVGELMREYETMVALGGAGVVVGSVVDPKTIANDHIRIHALEGQLFRTIVEDVIGRHRIPCSTWRQRDLHEAAAKILKLREPAIRERVAALGRDVEGPWRAEQKTAALAAWMVLAGGPRKAKS